MAQVSDVMTHEVWVVSPDTPVVDALQIAASHDVEHLPVLENNYLLGLVCACDLESARLNEPVGLVMHAPAKVIQADSSLEDAATTMEEGDVGSLIVLSGSTIVGLLTKDDLSRSSESEARGLSRCAACGSYQHLRPARAGTLVLCTGCSGLQNAPADERELGSGD